MKIDIWSDVVCPFCYLGKAKLEKAISKLGVADQVDVEWHSFQLDPDFPKDTAIPSTEYLAQRKGMQAVQIKSGQQHIAQQGQVYGIDFHFDKALNFNTIDVHRLLHWSKAFNKMTDLKTALLKAHFSDGIDLSKNENILTVVNSIGLDRESATNVLNSDSYAQEVKIDIDLARQIGISGVPFFVFNKKTAISGAQPDNVFEEVLNEALDS